MYFIFLVCSILFLIEEYIRLLHIGFTNTFMTEEAFLMFFLVASIGYLYKSRKQNLFCFETFFLVFSLLINFFDYLVLSVASDTGLVGSLFNRYGEDTRFKTMYISNIVTLMFILGSYVSDIKIEKKTSMVPQQTILNNNISVYELQTISKILTTITLLYFGYLFAIGYVSSWFRYGCDSSSYTNTKVVYLTVLCLSSTIAQFAQYAGSTFDSVRSFIKKINKFYLAVIGIVTFLLLISGNRNEALYIILPMLACYSIIVKNITNKQFYFLFLLGFLLLVFIGLTRQTGVENGAGGGLNFDLFKFTHDFGYANIDSMYLIEDTDRNGFRGFNNGFVVLLSSVPFLGGFVVTTFGIEEFTRSAVATTEGLDISYTGLGTSLIGDTYYTGGIVFSIIFFYFLGRCMSYLHNRYYKDKIINIYNLSIYAFMFSNAIYCLRSEWYTSFRYIGFCIIVLYIVCHIKRKRI